MRKKIHVHVKGRKDPYVIDATQFSKFDWGIEIIVGAERLLIPWHNVDLIKVMSS